MFLSGESYAGFYISFIAEHIVSNQLVPSVPMMGSGPIGVGGEMRTPAFVRDPKLGAL